MLVCVGLAFPSFQRVFLVWFLNPLSRCSDQMLQHGVGLGLVWGWFCSVCYLSCLFVVMTSHALQHVCVCVEASCVGFLVIMHLSFAHTLNWFGGGSGVIRGLFGVRPGIVRQSFGVSFCRSSVAAKKSI